MTEQSFEGLGLIEPLLRAIKNEGYETPTPIQAASIPALLEKRDLLGCARTGTGKTAAFALPTLQRLAAVDAPRRPKYPRGLVLTPTRELAIQIKDSFLAYGRHLSLRTAVVHGGVPFGGQSHALNRGVDVLVATPGRLMDLMNRKMVRLDHVEVFTLDEADRMLDMGFIHDVRTIVASVPMKRQSLFFSATMPPEVAKLAAGFLNDPVKVEVDPVSAAAVRVDQKVMFVDKKNKNALLDSLLDDPAVSRAIIFTRTKHMANRVAERLAKDGVSAEAIHGNKSQGARQRALKNFETGRVRILVATDIAARGIDIDGVSHVINYEMPADPESYVHRIGRTGRAGAAGIAWSLCDQDEGGTLAAIERLTKINLPVIDDHAFHCNVAATSRRKPEMGRRNTVRRPFRGGSNAAPRQNAARHR
jgi:ATP-dependent RNA helicase RhlE